MDSKKRPVTNEGKMFASVIMWFIVTIILGTFAGIWIKLFWLGWVLNGC